MFRKFVEGLVFGAGFAIAFFILAAVAGSMMFSSLPSRSWSTSVPVPMEGAPDSDDGDSRQFYELPIEEKIEAASVIALARFEPAEDGRKKAVLKEILKKNEGTTFYYDIGDEFGPLSRYPKENAGYGDGIIIFFEGSPAMMRSAMTFSGDRIAGLGDMPLELLREKCGEEESQSAG